MIDFNTSVAREGRIKAKRNNPFQFTMQVMDQLSESTDISEYIPKLAVYDSAGDGAPFLVFTLGNGITLEGTDTWIFQKQAAQMDWEGVYFFRFFPYEGMEWIFGDFVIGELPGEEFTSEIFVNITEGLSIQINILGGGGGPGAIPETPETIAQKYETHQNVKRFTTEAEQRLYSLPTGNELQVQLAAMVTREENKGLILLTLIEKLENLPTVAQLQATIAELQNRIAVLEGGGLVAPNNLSLDNDNFDEGNAGDVFVGTITVMGMPAPTLSLGGENQSYELRENPDQPGQFNKLWFTGFAVHDLKSQYALMLIADNGVPPSLEVPVIIYINKVYAEENSPTFIELDNVDVLENMPAGTLVGIIFTDGDPAPTLTVTGEDSDKLEVANGNELVTKVVLDYEAKAELHFNLNADNGKTPLSVPFTVYVGDVAENITAGWTPTQTYNLVAPGNTFATWENYTSPFSFKFTGQFNSNAAGIILEKGDTSVGCGIWCANGKMYARMGAAAQVGQVLTLEIDLSVLTGTNEFLFCFIPGTPMKIVAFVNNVKFRWIQGGSYANTANTSGGGYGVMGGSTAPVGMPNSAFTGGTLGAQAFRYHNLLPQNV